MPAVRLNPDAARDVEAPSLRPPCLGRSRRIADGFDEGVLLETIGHKTGQPRAVGLSHLEMDGGYFVMASYAGEDRDPARAKNPRAHPRATVSIGGRSTPVIARALEGAVFELRPEGG